MKFLKKIAYFLKLGYLIRRFFPKLFLELKTFFLLRQRPEARELSLLMEEEEFDFIDIGAFHGVYTNLAIKSKYSSKIIAVEANYTNYNFLKENFKGTNFSIKNNIFSSTLGEVSFFIPILHNAQYGEFENGLGSAIKGRFENEKEIKLKTITLPKLYSGLISNCNSLIIKVDIEGLEEEFVDSLQLCNFYHKRIVVLMELSHDNIKSIMLKMENLGYRVLCKGDIYENTQDHIFLKIQD